MIEITRKTFLATVAVACLMPLATMAQEKHVLKVHSFSSTQAPEAIHMVQPFIDAVEAQSIGRLDVEFYPSMQLGGAPSDLIEQLEDGVVDIIVMIPGLTPGRFSGLEGMDMPFTNVGTSAGQTAALLGFANKWLLDNEFKGIKILHMHTTDAAVFHTIDKPIEKLEDFAGMKLRAPGRYLGEAVKIWGGTPVGLPLGEVYEALERHQVDGMAINWAIIPPYKFQDVTKYHLETPIYQNAIMVLMSQESFDKLPADLQSVIDANIGLEKSIAVAKEIDKLTDKAKEATKAAGGVLYSLTDAERDRWKGSLQPVYQLWIDEMNKRGLPGQEMFDSMLQITADNGRK